METIKNKFIGNDLGKRFVGKVENDILYQIKNAIKSLCHLGK